ncbi:hypothetical protein FH972_002137 [Carpinus fangiana]|uniref:Uncharacterized protein n=1 Tax=Carpinus fangiana TaxID=176857 RepID=A0A5N6QE02_9ROSI|nr:hypothetical protein FH972_002137 [Carpinus fangiana]
MHVRGIVLEVSWNLEGTSEKYAGETLPAEPWRAALAWHGGHPISPSLPLSVFTHRERVSNGGRRWMVREGGRAGDPALGQAVTHAWVATTHGQSLASQSTLSRMGGRALAWVSPLSRIPPAIARNLLNCFLQALHLSFSGTAGEGTDERRVTVVEPNGVFQLLDLLGGWRCLIGVALTKTVLYENNLKRNKNSVLASDLISYCGGPPLTTPTAEYPSISSSIFLS